MTTESDGQPAEKHGRPRRPGSLVPLAVVLTLLAACGGADAGAGRPPRTETLTLYTCLSDESIQPVIEAFEDGAPGTQVDLFRAPTGELNARVAADVRSGGLQADVFWGCDPLTVQSLVDQDLVGGWTPPEAEDIPAEFRTDDYVGAHLLYMVAVHRTDVPAPASWSDLADPRYAGRPSPTRRSPPRPSGALGWFAADARLRRRLLPRPAGQRRRPGGHARRGDHRGGAGHLRRRDDDRHLGLRGRGRRLAGGRRVAGTGCGGDLRPGRARHRQRRLAGREGLHLLRGRARGPDRAGRVGLVPDPAGHARPDHPGRRAGRLARTGRAIGQDKDAVLAEYQQVFGG